MTELQNELRDFIARALEEDLGSGDHSSLACIDAHARGKAQLLVKERGILAGVQAARQVFEQVDPELKMQEFIQDGQAVEPGQIAFTVEGHSRSILVAERLALNIMQRMSGIATMSRRFVDAVAGTKARILDTRKTTPTLRFLEKWAVRVGGAENYRSGLYDRIMIKDNHIDFCGSVSQALERAKSYLKEKNLGLEITVEVRNLDELEELLKFDGYQRIMLDNFAPRLIMQALERIKGSYETEASGGITIDNVAAYARTGVDFISIGALTHSFRSLDLSLKEVKL